MRDIAVGDAGYAFLCRSLACALSLFYRRREEKQVSVGSPTIIFQPAPAKRKKARGEAKNGEGEQTNRAAGGTRHMKRSASPVDGVPTRLGDALWPGVTRNLARPWDLAGSSEPSWCEGARREHRVVSDAHHAFRHLAPRLLLACSGLPFADDKNHGMSPGSRSGRG